MKIQQSAISLNVEDVEASASFAEQHLGFEREMSADGFASLRNVDAGFNLIYLATDLSTFKPERLAGHAADGLLVVFVVDDVDQVYAELEGGQAEVVTPIETEEWGERYFQVGDANGVVYQFVQWVDGNDA